MILRCQGLLASSQIVQISIGCFIYYTPDTNMIYYGLISISEILIDPNTRCYRHHVLFAANQVHHSQ